MLHVVFSTFHDLEDPIGPNAKQTDLVQHTKTSLRRSETEFAI